MSADEGKLWECCGCGHRQAQRFEPYPCPNCHRFYNTRFARVGPADRGPAVDDGEVISLSDVDTTEAKRIQIGGAFASIDELLGGGIVDGRGVYLLAGDAGIGKSTLLTQLMQSLARQGRRVLYATAEESVKQVAIRSKRFGAMDSRLMIVRDNELEEILASATEHEAQIVVIDSVNTLVVCSAATGDEFEVGSAMAVTTAMRAIVEFSSEEDVPVFVVNHVTKAGLAAGPNTAAHLADTVMFFEGEEGKPERAVSIPSKNRFGAVGARARFVMGEAGLAPLPSAPTPP